MSMTLTKLCSSLTPCPIHTTPQKFENAALFLRLSLPFTLILHENKAFRRRSSNRRNLETTTLRFSVEGKHFESGAFRKRKLPECCSTTNPKWAVNVAFSKSSGVVWTGIDSNMLQILRSFVIKTDHVSAVYWLRNRRFLYKHYVNLTLSRQSRAWNSAKFLIYV